MSEIINVTGLPLGNPAALRKHRRRQRLRLYRRGRFLIVSLMASPAILSLVIGLFGAPTPPTAPSDGDAKSKDKHGIIGLEDRRPLAEFVLPGAPDQQIVRAGLRPTQHLSCGSASASLVYRPDVIVFAAHELLENNKIDLDVVKCTFDVAWVENGETKVDRYPLRVDTIDFGDLPGKPWTEGNVRDWAIARLARPVPGIVPYRLPEADDTDVPGTSVVAVSSGTDNWPGSPGSDKTTRLAEACHTVRADPDLGGSRGVMHLDCDVGHGASGGAFVIDAASGHPRYLGTIIAYSGHNCSHAGYKTCFSIGRRLDKDLVARVRGTTALGTAEDAPFVAAQTERLKAPRDAVAVAALAALTLPFPAQDDSPGRAVAALYTEICALDREGKPAEAEALVLRAVRLLNDPDRTRPEWPWILMEDGASLLARGQNADAFQSFRMAEAAAPADLKPALRLRMALITTDPGKRAAALRDAYLESGDGLFRAFGADRDLAAVEQHGLETISETKEAQGDD